MDGIFAESDGLSMDTVGSIQRSPTLAALFGAPVAAFETREPGDPRMLAPEEAAHVARAAPKRVAEFAASRACARSALAELGVPQFILLVGPDREPLWPPGVVGSITHVTGFCGVVAARIGTVRSLGLDAERRDAVHQRLWRQIATTEELVRLESLNPDSATEFATLIFSAKEAFYKCQFPLTREWLSFNDVSVSVERDTFEILPRRTLALEAIAPAPWSGRFTRTDALVLSGCMLAAASI